MAVINVTPQTSISSLIASDNVKEGDVLLLEEGIYYQSVITFKNNISIIAKGPGVIFDGNSSIFTAITLSDVVGVVIEGISMRNYFSGGISILFGSGNRIINNKIDRVTDGIHMRNSSGNLIYRNEMCNCINGVSFIFGSRNNWIIENKVKDCAGNAFQPSSAADSNNAFISNIAIRSSYSGLYLPGSNYLLLNNQLIDNGQGLVIDDGSNSVAIGNKVKGTKSTGQFVPNAYRNYFAGENHMVCNRGSGIENLSDFGIFLDNEISYNADTGIILDTTAVGNLVLENKLKCNVPQNIVDRGTDNNLISNIDKPCEPCEIPSDVCCDLKE